MWWLQQSHISETSLKYKCSWSSIRNQHTSNFSEMRWWLDDTKAKFCHEWSEKKNHYKRTCRKYRHVDCRFQQIRQIIETRHIEFFKSYIYRHLSWYSGNDDAKKDWSHWRSMVEVCVDWSLLWVYYSPRDEYSATSICQILLIGWLVQGIFNTLWSLFTAWK